MIKIFLDQVRQRNQDYIEDYYSAFEIIEMDHVMFASVIMRFSEKRAIHSCYAEFINHIGRFHREFGPMWAHEDIVIYAKQRNDNDYTEYHFNEKGQIENWHYGFFG